ncbi:hypothetical protein ACQ4PT_024000 [Festuca glaucescens]
MSPPPTPALPVEILEEIFLCLPPDEPAWLMRASLASKFWLGLLTGPRFRGLLPNGGGPPKEFGSIGATVLCVVSGCDHRACHEGPFWVVFVGLDKVGGGCLAYEYESMFSPARKRIKWSEPCHGLDHLADDAEIQQLPPVLIGDALHLILMYDDDHIEILKYELGSKCFSLIDAPLGETHIARDVILIAMENGSLGFAHVDGSILNLWSRQMGSGGVAAWTDL